jgi:mannosyltransferase OCH1-like enzyme
MPIPKVLYQTYISYNKLPIATRGYIRSMRRYCRGFTYEFFDDDRIEGFLSDEYGPKVLGSYRRIAIGAAKADFFRYAILLRKGGVYLDVDSMLTGRLDELIEPADEAIISREGNPEFYVQWALAYGPGHPFLAATLDKVLSNIEADRFPRDVHRMTGPSAYTEAIRECLAVKGQSIPYRELGVDYEGYFKYKQPWARLLYLRRPNWRKVQQERGVLHPRRA